MMLEKEKQPAEKVGVFFMCGNGFVSFLFFACPHP